MQFSKRLNVQQATGIRLVQMLSEGGGGEDDDDDDDDGNVVDDEEEADAEAGRGAVSVSNDD